MKDKSRGTGKPTGGGTETRGFGMKINSVSAYGVYKQAARKPEAEMSFAAALEAAGRKKHTDRISISTQGARQLEAERLTRAVMDEMQKPSDPGKLERISSAVKDGTYHIPTGELADAVMQRWLGL